MESSSTSNYLFGVFEHLHNAVHTYGLLAWTPFSTIYRLYIQCLYDSIIWCSELDACISECINLPMRTSASAGRRRPVAETKPSPGAGNGAFTCVPFHTWHANQDPLPEQTGIQKGLLYQVSLPKDSMYSIYAYIGVVWGVNGAAYIPVPWSVWVMVWFLRFESCHATVPASTSRLTCPVHCLGFMAGPRAIPRWYRPPGLIYRGIRHLYPSTFLYNLPYSQLPQTHHLDSHWVELTRG